MAKYKFLDGEATIGLITDTVLSLPEPIRAYYDLKFKGIENEVIEGRIIGKNPISLQDLISSPEISCMIPKETVKDILVKKGHLVGEDAYDHILHHLMAVELPNYVPTELYFPNTDQQQ